MMKRLIALITFLLMTTNVYAKTDFSVDMQMQVPDLNEYMKKFMNDKDVYYRGYSSRFTMGKMFKKEFSRTIKNYGMSEVRIKNEFEDELLEVLSFVPKKMYQYIGPMLHNTAGISDKILNLPGIRETKNQFPKDIAEQFKNDPNIEFLSPELYFMLMPEIWGDKIEEDLDTPQPQKVKKPKKYVNNGIPRFLLEKYDLPLDVADKKAGSAKKKAAPSIKLNIRTLNPSLTTPLTGKDVEAFISTLDEINEFGNANEYENFSKLIVGEALLMMVELEHGEDMSKIDLEGMVNPCQRLVLKTKFSGIYDKFTSIVVKKGFSPEEWAYTCDKTIKAFRVSEANLAKAHAVKAYREGYYNQYFDKLPEKWRKRFYANQDAIVQMYSVFAEDVETVKPYRAEIAKKMLESSRTILTEPVFY